MLDDVGVLFVLVIGAVCFDDAIYSVDSACDAIASDELGQIPTIVSGYDCYALIRPTRTYRSKKSTVTPKSLAMLFNPTTR